jgi:hypothetical protein
MMRIVEAYGPNLETVYIVLVNGFQWGPEGSPRDRSGAAGDYYATPEEAQRAYEEDSQ